MTRIELPGYEIVGIRAANPGVFTLSGTNTWVVGRDPAWVVDPGPELPEHLDAVVEELSRRGELGGIALTHDHPDHAAAVPALRERFPAAPVAAARDPVDLELTEGGTFGPLEVIHTPGHAPDHLAFLSGGAAFTGDAVLGEGSVFLWPDPGALAGYLDGLGRLRERDPSILCPGHGPPVHDAIAKLDEYIGHRLERERRLVEAIGDGKRTVAELLDTVWDDVPQPLRPAAAVTLAAHLDKLAGERRLPADVERPELRL